MYSSGLADIRYAGMQEVFCATIRISRDGFENSKQVILLEFE